MMTQFSPAMGQPQFAGKAQAPAKSLFNKIGGAIAGAAMIATAGAVPADTFTASKAVAQTTSTQAATSIQAEKPSSAQLQMEFTDRLVDLMNLVVKLAEDEKQPALAGQFQSKLKDADDVKKYLGEVDFSKPLTDEQKHVIQVYTHAALNAHREFGGIFEQNPAFLEKFAEKAFNQPESDLYKARMAMNEAVRKILEHEASHGNHGGVQVP